MKTTKSVALWACVGGALATCGTHVHGQQQLATGLHYPRLEAVRNGAIIFFDHAPDGNDELEWVLKKVPVAGGTVTTITSGTCPFDSGHYRCTDPHVAQADDVRIFGGVGGYNTSYLFSAPLAGGPPTTLLTFSGGDFLGISQAYVYFASGFSSINRVPKTGGAVEAIGGGWAKNSAIDSSALYFVEYFSHNIERLDLANFNVLHLVTGNASGSVIFSDANSVYYYYTDPGADVLYKVPNTGGASTPIYTTPDPFDVANPELFSDGSRIYYIEFGNAIRSLSVNGGPATTIVTRTGIHSFVVDGNTLYWSEGPLDAGRILRTSLVTGPPWLAVAPATSADFGSVVTGTASNRPFTVSNGGGGTVTGTASTSPPFSIVGGGTYSLLGGQSQTVTVRYAPASVGTDFGHVTFTGPTTQTRQLIGSAYATQTLGSIQGTVTRADTGVPLSGIKVAINGDPKNTDSEGKYAFDVQPGCCYSLQASDPYGRFLPQQYDQIAAAVGTATTVDFALNSVFTQSPTQYPVLLVSGFSCELFPYDSGNCFPDLCGSASGYCENETWAAVTTKLKAAGFADDFIWDPNKPELDVSGGAGNVIQGTDVIFWNRIRLFDYITDKVRKFQKDPSHPYYPGKINIVASSMGGLIVRDMLSSDKLTLPISPNLVDRLELGVDKVIMLGTPNAGTPLANLFDNIVGIFACGANSVHDLTTHYVRDVFNPNRPWPSGVNLYLRAGTSVDAGSCPDLKDGSWWIAFLNSPDEAVNDGAVPETSAPSRMIRGVPESCACPSGPIYLVGTRAA